MTVYFGCRQSRKTSGKSNNSQEIKSENLQKSRKWIILIVKLFNKIKILPYKQKDRKWLIRPYTTVKMYGAI